MYTKFSFYMGTGGFQCLALLNYLSPLSNSAPVLLFFILHTVLLNNSSFSASMAQTLLIRVLSVIGGTPLYFSS